MSPDPRAGYSLSKKDSEQGRREQFERIREKRLAEFRKSKKGRTLAEAEELLRMFGFIGRAANKEASVWHRGSVGLTLPNPRDYLLIPYVSLVIRKIEEAKAAKVPEENIS
jgi:hypothetical protein